MTSDEIFTLTVDGRRYERWEEVRVTREIDRMCTDFNIAVSERFLAGAADLPLAPFMPCTVAIGGDVVLTGYVDNYLPEVEADRHTVRITGRSKTEDIIDCTPDIQGGQFAGYKLDAIARAIGGHCRGRSQRWTALLPLEIGEWKSSKDDAAEREHSARALNQIGIGIEFGFLCQPVEALSGLCDCRHGELTARGDLDQHMHPNMRGDAAAGEFGRDLASFGIEDDL